MLFSAVWLIAAPKLPTKDMTTLCVPNAPDGYCRSRSSAVVIDGTNSASPAIITVPDKTKVTIHVIKAHADDPSETAAPPSRKLTKG